MSPLTKLKAFINTSESNTIELGAKVVQNGASSSEQAQTGIKPKIVQDIAPAKDGAITPELNSKVIPIAAPTQHNSATHPRKEPHNMITQRKSNDNPTDASAPRELGPTGKTNNLSHIRADLAQLNDDMSSGEQFYAQSLKRINNLISYAYETEVNLSALEHLEPENAQLKEDLDKARKRVNDEVLRAESFKTKAETYETRYVSTRQSLEKVQLSLTKLEADRDALERKLSDSEVEISGLTNSNRTIRNELDIDRQSHEKLSSKNLSLSSGLSIALSEKLELEKRHLEASAKLESLKSGKADLERILAQSRSLHQTAEDQNISLKAEMEQILADVKLFKQQFETSTHNGTAELNNLRAKLVDLQTEIQIKEDIVEHNRQETTELRAKYEAANRGRKNLMSHIEDQKAKFETLYNSAQKAKATTQESNSKVVTLQAEIDQLRRANSAQSEKLKQYMAITSTPMSMAPSVAPSSASSSIITASQITASKAPQTNVMSIDSIIGAVINPASTAASNGVIQEPLESRARRRAERQAREGLI